MSVEKALFGNSSYQLLRGALDAASLRQKVIADNVANAETPGFKPHEVEFESLLDNAMGNGNGGGPLKVAVDAGHHLLPGGTSGGVPRPQVVESAPRGVNGTGDPGDFDMERAMAELSENRVQYAAVAQLLSNKLIMLKTAIESK
jgi:flagellar basal-body rod protein FlgB